MIRWIVRVGVAIIMVATLGGSLPASAQADSLNIDYVGWHLASNGIDVDKVSLSFDANLIGKYEVAVELLDNDKGVVSSGNCVFSNLDKKDKLTINLSDASVAIVYYIRVTVKKLPVTRPSGGAAYIPPRPTTEIAGPACEWKIIQLTVSPYQVNVGEPVTVGVLIANPCDESQECEVVLKINGVVEGEKEVEVKPGDTEQVTFIISKHAVGTYSIEVNGYYAGTLVVKEMEFPAPPQPTARPINWWLIVIIALVAAAIASLITYLVYRKKKQAGGSPSN